MEKYFQNQLSCKSGSNALYSDGNRFSWGRKVISTFSGACHWFYCCPNPEYQCFSANIRIKIPSRVFIRNTQLQQWINHHLNEKQHSDSENTHVHMVYVTHTAAPRNDGKHSSVMKMVVIWEARHGFPDAWQFIIRLTCDKQHNHRGVRIILVNRFANDSFESLLKRCSCTVLYGLFVVVK